MTVKVLIEPANGSVRSFPYLARNRHTGHVVLFVSVDEAVALNTVVGTVYSVGDTFKAIPSYYEAFQGSVTISNASE